jgi:hypothetical protein
LQIKLTLEATCWMFNDDQLNTQRRHVGTSTATIEKMFGARRRHVGRSTAPAARSTPFSGSLPRRTSRYTPPGDRTAYRVG